MWQCFLPMLITHIFSVIRTKYSDWCAAIELNLAKLKKRASCMLKLIASAVFLQLEGRLVCQYMKKRPQRSPLLALFFSGSFLFSSFVCFDRRQTIVLSLDFCAKTRQCVCVNDVSGLINGERGSEIKGYQVCGCGCQRAGQRNSRDWRAINDDDPSHRL